MSHTSNIRNGRLAPSMLAMGIALALSPGLSFAASEDTIIVDGTSNTGNDSETQDYSVKTTTAGTKMQMVQRDIPQSVTIVSEQRMHCLLYTSDAADEQLYV